LAIAGLLILSSLTIGSRPAKAQACIVNPDGTAMCTIPTQIGTFTVNANGNTGTFSGTCPNGQTFTGHVGQGSTTDQRIASSTIAFSGSCFPGGGSAQNAVSLQNSVQAARQSSQVSMTAVQSQLTSIRDSIQAGRSRPVTSGRPIGFAAEPTSDRLESNP